MKRRNFLRAAGMLTGGVLTGYVLNLSGCAAEQPTPDNKKQLRSGEVLLGLYGSKDVTTPEGAVRQSLAHLDFSWLGSGDTVFVKLSCNSGRVHPAVTSPAAVSGLCRELFARGAGRVIVGDQAGVESVRLAPGEARFSSTQKLMEGNGLYAAIKAAGAEPHFFDDQGYKAGYFEATLPASHHWKQPMMLPNIIKQVEHIVYLPRLSSHTLAGYTHGLKCAVGWLRDDSRYHMHNDAVSLHEKYTEISYSSEIASRLRLIFTFAEGLMLHQGPDTGTVAVADPRIVIASDNIANHDAFSATLLRYFDTNTPSADGISPYGEGNLADIRNNFFVRSYVKNATGIPWGEGGKDYTKLRAHKYWESISSDLGLSRAYEIQGGAPKSITVQLDGAPLATELKAALSKSNAGIFDILG